MNTTTQSQSILPYISSLSQALQTWDYGQKKFVLKWKSCSRLSCTSRNWWLSLAAVWMYVACIHITDLNHWFGHLQLTRCQVIYAKTEFLFFHMCSLSKQFECAIFTNLRSTSIGMWVCIYVCVTWGKCVHVLVYFPNASKFTSKVPVTQIWSPVSNSLVVRNMVSNQIRTVQIIIKS